MILTKPPDQYNKDYFQQVWNALAQYFQQLDNPAKVTMASLNMTSVPNSGYNLRVGDVYQDDGTLKIVLTGQAFAPTSLFMSSAVGQVTVTIV